RTPLAMALLFQWLVIGAGAAGGTLVSRLMGHALARSIDREQRSRELLTAAAASEGRYRLLFQRSPTPLLLHRNGIVFDANEAAAAMFGFDRVEEMHGYDLRQAYVDPDSLRRVQQRIAMLESMPSGGGLPMDEFQLVS